MQAKLQRAEEENELLTLQLEQKQQSEVRLLRRCCELTVFLMVQDQQQAQQEGANVDWRERAQQYLEKIASLEDEASVVMDQNLQLERVNQELQNAIKQRDEQSEWLDRNSDEPQTETQTEMTRELEMRKEALSNQLQELKLQNSEVARQADEIASLQEQLQQHAADAASFEEERANMQQAAMQNDRALRKELSELSEQRDGWTAQKAALEIAQLGGAATNNAALHEQISRLEQQQREWNVLKIVLEQTVEDQLQKHVSSASQLQQAKIEVDGLRGQKVEIEGQITRMLSAMNVENSEQEGLAKLVQDQQAQLERERALMQQTISSQQKQSLERMRKLSMEIEMERAGFQQQETALREQVTMLIHERDNVVVLLSESGGTQEAQIASNASLCISLAELREKENVWRSEKSVLEQTVSKLQQGAGAC